MRLPKPNTLAGRALSRLLLHKSLTSIEFQGDTKTYRLGGYIHVLRTRYGWPVQSQIKTVTTSDHGRKAPIAVYSLNYDYKTSLLARYQEEIHEFCLAVKHFEEA